MPKRSELEKGRFHIMLYKEDVEFLEAEYGKNARVPIGLSESICRIVHAKVLDIKGKAAAEHERIARERQA